MRIRTTPGELLLRLPLQSDAGAQAASFRQALTAVAHATSALGPPPLDGVDRRALEAAAHVALQKGFADDLEFIDPGTAAVALYELSSALPSGSVKRDLRRRVFSFLYEGNAAAFVPVAGRIALGAAAPLSTPTLQARVALCLDLPLGSNINVAPLALALATRSATHPNWVRRPSTRALPQRRLAAQIYEHAAREAVFRYQLGDPQPLKSLLNPTLQESFQRLIQDREPLVWQPASVARGLLAAIDTGVRAEVEESLDPSLGVTEWRRGAVSLLSSVVLGDEEAYLSVLSVLDGPLVNEDDGLPAALVSALPHVAEVEPERAEEVAERLSNFERPDVAVAMAHFYSKCRDVDFAPRARLKSRDVLAEVGRKQSSLERSLSTRALRVLSGTIEDEPDLVARVHHALMTFEEKDAKSAYETALLALSEAHEIASFIEANDPVVEEGLGAAISSLVELDSGALQNATLSNLLLLGRAPGDKGGIVEPFERLQNRTGKWILDGVKKAGEEEWSREGAKADQRRLMVLLHLVDADSPAALDAEHRPIVVRLQQAIAILLERLAAGPDAVVHRVLCAVLARSFDAAVREEVMQASDLILMVASRLHDPHAVRIISEASTTHDVSGPLAALADFISPALLDPHEADSSPGLGIDPASVTSEEVAEQLRRIRRLTVLSQGLVGGGGYHAEALRRVFFRLARALERVAVARGQAELVQPRDTGAPVLEDLAIACDELGKMMRCAERRVVAVDRGPRESSDETGLYEVIERGIESERPPGSEDISRAIEEMVRQLPEPVARAIEQVVFRIQSLPRSGAGAVKKNTLTHRRAVLPNWLLPRRSIGSFHVVRPLGSGGVSSVFLVRRLEERSNQAAEAFALKVPEYDPATARSMSEQEFFQMFHDEAGALLSLPAHENLARFVTFDLSARPKPILVMELIRGTPLDRLLRSKALTMPRVISHLDGMLAGLEAMHAVEVGHLDIKASNVILRDGKVPVLVDFGLSGRAVRRGCGTIEYTAPEVLGVVPEGVTITPMAADIYAFGCLMFEMLTGEVLFTGADEMALVSKHISHDGWFGPLISMSQVPGLDRLANLIGMCLRHDGRNRPSSSKLREELTPALLPLASVEWPLRLGTAAPQG